MAITTSMDIESSLQKALGPTVLEQSIQIYKERNKRNCLIKPKGALPYHIWRQIQREVKKLGGKWTRKNRLWEVPLDGRNTGNSATS